MAKATFDLLVGAKGALGESNKGLDYSVISPYVRAFNRATTPQAKREQLEQIERLVKRNADRQRQRDAEREQTGACSAQFSSCGGQ